MARTKQQARTEDRAKRRHEQAKSSKQATRKFRPKQATTSAETAKRAAESAKGKSAKRSADFIRGAKSDFQKGLARKSISTTSRYMKPLEGKVGSASSKALARLQKAKKAAGTLPKIAGAAARFAGRRLSGGPGMTRKELEKAAGTLKRKPTTKKPAGMTSKREAKAQMRRSKKKKG